MEYKSLSPFPKDFFWGAATAAYQVEGGVLEDGKTLSIVDLSINSKYADTSVTSDHYHRFKEDVSLMKELGLKAYRFSIAWTRILPQGRGRVNQKGINFYKSLIRELKSNNIEPLVTIYHFDLPVTLQNEYGGWQSRNIIRDFSEFCRVLFENFGDEVKYWFTINEQSNMFLLPYLMEFNDKEPIDKQRYEMNHIMTLSHAAATKLCREIIPDAKIGPAIGLAPNYPATCNPRDILAAMTADDYRSFFFTDLYVYGEYRKNIWNYLKDNDLIPNIHDGDMDLLKEGRPDFLGINYYASRVVKYASKSVGSKEASLNKDGDSDETEFEVMPGMYEGDANPYLEKTAWDWEIDPIGLRILLNQLNERYHLPIIITENGMGAVEEKTIDNTVHDIHRINYLREHISQIQLAITDGVDVFGYCPWSFIDLLSTSSGFRKRYGLIYVNRTDDDLLDLARYKKDSFYWYQQVISSNQI